MGLFKKIFTKVKKDQGLLVEKLSIQDLFEELDEISLKKKRITQYILSLEKRQEELEKFKVLDKESIEKLNHLATQAKDIEEKKQNLRGRLIKNNKSLFLISQYAEQLPELIQEMYDWEKRQKETERNIFYLDEEKNELLEERITLLKGYQFLKRFSIVFVIVLALCMLVAAAMLQMLRDEIWIFLSLLGSFLIVFLVGIIYSKEKIENSLRNNTILQQKAVKYLNKCKISYFNQTRYLQFQYDKLGVDSVAKLEMYYNRYIKNKDNESRYIKLNQVLAQIEEKMLDILKSKGIQLNHIENLTDWAISPQKINSVKMFEEDMRKNKEQFDALNSYEETLWKEIFTMQEQDDSKKMIQAKIEEYHNKIKQS